MSAPLRKNLKSSLNFVHGIEESGCIVAVKWGADQGAADIKKHQIENELLCDVSRYFFCTVTII